MEDQEIGCQKIPKIYDLRKRTYVFAINIIKFIRGFIKDHSSQIISKQLIRSATSIGANVIEGRASSSRKDFINFHNHALKSANETKFWLGLARDSEIAPYAETKTLLAEATELANILAAIIITSKNKR